MFEHVGGESSRVLQMPRLPIRDNRCLITGQAADIQGNLELESMSNGKQDGNELNIAWKLPILLRSARTCACALVAI